MDFLIINSPPGTGGEPLTVAQQTPDDRAVIVPPQEVPLADVGTGNGGVAVMFP